jgi:hypothetical protein
LSFYGGTALFGDLALARGDGRYALRGCEIRTRSGDEFGRTSGSNCMSTSRDPHRSQR